MFYASLKHTSNFFFQTNEDRGIRNLKGIFLFSVSEKHSFLEVNKKVLLVQNKYTAASNIMKQVFYMYLYMLNIKSVF